jgi:hypothetical protein
MAPSRKPSGWMQRNAARVRIWIEEGVLENAEADRLSQGIFDRMTTHQRTANTSRRVVTEYDELALVKFMMAAGEFLEESQNTPEVGQPGSDPPEQPRIEAREEEAPDEWRMILGEEAQARMEANEQRQAFAGMAELTARGPSTTNPVFTVTRSASGGTHFGRRRGIRRLGG